MKIKRIVAIVMTVAFMLCCAAMPVAAAAFSDTEGHWAANSIERWAAAGVLNGYEDGTYKPDNAITRAEMATILAEALGLDEAAKNEFKDVEGTEWFADDVLSCVKAGIIVGYEADGVKTFVPNNNIIRQDAFAMIDRAFGLEDGTAADLAAFTDAKDVSDYAVGSVTALVNYGAVEGYKGELNPKDNITRAEVAKVLDYLVAIYVDAEGNLYESIDDTAVGNVVVVNQHVEKDIVVAADAATAKVTVTIGEVKAEATVTNEKPVIVVLGAEKQVAVYPVVIEKAEHAEFCEHVWAHKDDCTKSCEVAHEAEGVCLECGVEAVVEFEATIHMFDEDGVCWNCGKKMADAEKFFLEVASNDQHVNATVTDDYAAVIEVTPGQVDAGNVTLTARMQNVGSLGVGEKREHSVNINTGMNGDPSLNVWLDSVWAFDAATVEVNVTNGDETVSASYDVYGFNEDINETAVIYADPTNVEDMRTAWHAIVNDENITTKTQEKDDSYVKIAKGSELTVLDETLAFEDDAEDLVLDNFSDFGSMEDIIRQSVVLRENGSVNENYQIVAKVAAGTELAVGSSVATLEKDCTVGIKGLNEEDFEGVLSELRDADKAYDMAVIVVNMIDNIIASANEGGVITVDFKF